MKQCPTCAVDDDGEVMAFDPSNIQRLMEQDELIDEYGPSAAPGLSHCAVQRQDDQELRQFIADCKDARLLPLTDAFREGIGDVLAYAEAEWEQRAIRTAKARSVARQAKAEGREDYASIKARTRIEDVFDQLCGAGRRQGDNIWYRCPFHEGDRTPSLEVTLSRQLFHCFACGVGGDAITLFQRKELMGGDG